MDEKKHVRIPAMFAGVWDLTEKIVEGPWGYMITEDPEIAITANNAEDIIGNMYSRDLATFVTLTRQALPDALIALAEMRDALQRIMDRSDIIEWDYNLTNAIEILAKYPLLDKPLPVPQTPEASQPL